MRILIFTLMLFCGNFLFAQQIIDSSLSHDGIDRTYSVYLPSSYTGDEAVPLVFNLHGYGSNSLEQMFYGDFRPIADTANFIIVHPQGTLLSGVSHWNVGGWTLGSTVDDVSFFSDLLDALIIDYNVDESRVYSTGMSNGGYMSFRLSCELSDRIAAVASVTGSMTPQITSQCAPSHPTPIMQIHGTADAVVPYDGAVWTNAITDVVKYWVDYNGCDDEPVEEIIPDIVQSDDCTALKETYSNEEGLEVIHYRILNGGHTWPGTFFGGSGTNADFNASLEIWKFFSKYSLPLINEINVLPQPSNTIQLIGSSIVSEFLQIESSLEDYFQIFSLEGKLMKNTKLNKGLNTIDVESLSEGLYYFRSHNQTIKFMKLGE